MPKVVIAQGTGATAMQSAIEDLGLEFVDLVKGATQIGIISTSPREVTQALIDAVVFHCRTPIRVLDTQERSRIVETSIPRPDDVRMPIHRPAMLGECDVIMMIGSFIPDARRRTEFVIEQYCFETWNVPERSSTNFLRPHDPWLEGDLRNEVIADLYAQKPITLSFLDGTSSSGILLASFDAIAVDAVAARTRDVDPESIGYLAELSRQGFGTCILSKIDVPLGMMLS